MSVINSVVPNASKAKGGLVFKNIKSYYEHAVRKGFFMPAYNSKFINQQTITQILNGEILQIRQDQVTFRVVLTPPSKPVLLKKLEGYLKTLNIKSGIDPDKSPDKEWLVLALATVSGGKDEIFEPNYMPNR